MFLLIPKTRIDLVLYKSVIMSYEETKRDNTGIISAGESERELSIKIERREQQISLVQAFR